MLDLIIVVGQEANKISKELVLEESQDKVGLVSESEMNPNRSKVFLET